MATSFLEARGEPARPEQRGYSIVYHAREVNHCPGCGRTHWYIGRLLAECAFCETALPLENGMVAGGNVFRHERRQPYFGQALAA